MTALPSAPLVALPPVPAFRPAVRAAGPAVQPAPPAAAEPATEPATEPQPLEPIAPPIAAEQIAPRQPRVELGFRDGSTAALAPGSEQAKALTDIASVLTKRD